MVSPRLENLRTRVYTHACPPFPTIVPFLPPHRCPTEPARRSATADADVFAAHGLRAGIAAAAIVEQPRGCQRRDRESLLLRSAKSARGSIEKRGGRSPNEPEGRRTDPNHAARTPIGCLPALPSPLM